MAVTALLDACRSCTESDGARGREDEFSGSDTLDRLEAPCPTEIVALRVRTAASLVSVRRRDDASTSVIRLGPGLTCGGVVDDDIPEMKKNVCVRETRRAHEGAKRIPTAPR